MIQKVIIEDSQSIGSWTPVVGPETDMLLNSLKLTEDGRTRILKEAVRVMRRCAPPDCSQQSPTGLVIGYVQSGKTMSFTTLATLARDNGFRIVVVIAGTSIPLFEQSSKRLKRDLRLEDREDRAWQLFENPEVKGPTAKTMADTLAEWDEGLPKSELKTLLIVVMKHHGRLQQLTTLLESLPLTDAPVLIIDDEADQASMNAAVRNDLETTTYSRIKALREAVPCHTFVQYTATPQAPLLINIIDILSPDFAEILTPGDEYVGGLQFFGDNSNLVREIPPDDILPAGEVPHEPPASLVTALQLFFIGVAAGIIKDESRGNRSMMVHPSQRVDSHTVFYNWIAAIKESWKALLQQAEGDADRDDLIIEFQSAYNDLAQTVSDLPPFTVILQRLPHAINRTVVNIINAATGKTPPVDWKGSYPHILVGGQAMDRGFTVEGLTVTYMPRSVGVGNADTIQQRARFFGYKKKYLGYCRVYLEGGGRKAYRHYVSHEEDMRERLRIHARSNAPLSEWKRMFFLTSSLRPTRQSVLDLEHMRLSFASKWFVIKAPHDDADAAVDNWKLVDQFFTNNPTEELEGHPERTEIQTHRLVVVPLQKALSELLAPFKCTRPTDSQGFTALRIQLLELADLDPSLTCSVFQMSSGLTRKRELTDADEIDNLFQGAYPDKTGKIYPGDQKILAPDVTIQVHQVTLHKKNGPNVAEDVPTLAIRMPPGKAEDLYIQLAEKHSKNG